jgi:ribonucleoside-triphosphate reductase
LVTQWLLEASLDGIGKHHLTSIFPISIFQYKQGTNSNKDDLNYDLKQLALKSMSKRIYPNWCNCDWSQAHEDINNPDTYFSTMGCRTLIGYDRHGLDYIRQGRGNNVPNTIILPKLGIEYGVCLGKREKPDLQRFWDAFEETLKLTEKALLERFNIMINQHPKSAPFMYQNKTIQDADNCKENVYNALKHNTLAIGYIGVAEMCQALFGKNHVHDEDVHAFALSVVKRINEFASESSERNNLNFSCYATPAEGLCRTALSALRDQYGIIENVTSHEYITNSHHVPVWEKVSIYDKLRIEAPFCKYPTGGCITYVELESMFVKNLKAVEDIIDYAFKVLDIPYLAFNFPIDSCLDCGYQDEFNNKCPQCNSDNIQQLRRVTGYLTMDYRNFNTGKQEEVKERVKHSAYTDFGDENIK